MSIIAKRLAPLGDNAATSAQHEEATRALGEALGFAATRPDNLHHTGPDVLWIDEEEKCCLLFELKTLQAGTKPLTKKAVGQGHDHLQWVKDNHPDIRIAGLIFVADTMTCFSDANPSEAMHVGSLTTIRQVGADFLTAIKSIRNALPLERLIKVNGFVADAANGLDRTMTKVAPTRLVGE